MKITKRQLRKVIREAILTRRLLSEKTWVEEQGAYEVSLNIDFVGDDEDEVVSWSVSRDGVEEETGDSMETLKSLQKRAMKDDDLDDLYQAADKVISRVNEW